MSESSTLPDDWERTLERSEFDQFMDREYTTIRYSHPTSGQEVIVNDVQEPNDFEGWGYLVRATGPEHGELDLVDDLDAAREIAIEFMASHSG